MKFLPARRFKNIYEQILLSRLFSLILGWLICVALPTVLYWNHKVLFSPNKAQLSALWVTSIAYICVHFASKRSISNFPGGRSSGLIIGQVLIFYGLAIAFVFISQTATSRALVLLSGGIALLWFTLDYLITGTYFKPKLAIVGSGITNELVDLKECDARLLTKLDLEDVRYDGVVADFYTANNAEQYFLTKCALNGIPVYNAKLAFESLTGRVKIDNMIENNIGSLLISPGYNFIKTLIDHIIVLATLPLTIPLTIFVSILIRVESPGPIIYTQTRIGKGNKPFKIYKFRTMRFDQDQAQVFAQNNDPRITKIGHWLRKLRIDEIPQFVNILKGDMSLIGPRPEQPEFVEEFNQKIPFYNYRHVVKPGITGWAQVRQGYAANIDETNLKIEHDFYYIKHCSLSLDMLIIILTIKTMLTGFGAR